VDGDNKDSYMKPINFLLLAIIFFLSPLAILSQAEETVGAPSAHFPETAYTFQPVVNGNPISHSYVVQNKGTAILEIQKVDTG
jgi:hypothetical protein